MISMILAMDINNLVGKDNDLPWYYKEDLKYFKKITLNKKVLMGYNTYLSIISRIGKPLPNRENYVLTFKNELPKGGNIVKDLDSFIKEYENSSEEIFVIGGKSVYELMIDKVSKIYLTRINKAYVGNVYLNCIDFSLFNLIKQELLDELSFEVYEKK